jgi:uncharacterized protein
MNERIPSVEKISNLVLVIAKALVDNGEKVSINKVEGSSVVILELSVGEGDLGKVIGKNGKIAVALRTIVNALGGKEGKNCKLEIIQ